MITSFRTTTGMALLTAGLLLTSGTARAQAFSEGDNSINVGYGFVTFLGSISENFDSYGDVQYKGMGPLYFKFEHAVTDHIGLGLNVAYATNEWVYNYQFDNSTYTETTKRSTYSVLARFNYHFGESEKFDPYFGMGLGFRQAKWTSEDSGPEGSGVELKSLMPFGMDLTLGARYFFTPNVALYAEVGAAKSVVQAGASFKF